MDQTSAYVKAETQKPQNSQNYEDGPKHTFLLQNYAAASARVSPHKGSGSRFDRRLHRDADRDSNIGIPAVEHVIAVVDVGHVNNVGVVPVIRPVLRPWVNSAKPIALVLEAWIPANDQERQPVDAEAVVRAKISSIAVARNAIAVVPASLLPVAVVRLPAVCAVLLPRRLLDMLLLPGAPGLFIASPLLRLLVLPLPLPLLGMLLLLSVLFGLLLAMLLLLVLMGLLMSMLLLFVLIRMIPLLSVLLGSRSFGLALLSLGMALAFRPVARAVRTREQQFREARTERRCS